MFQFIPFKTIFLECEIDNKPVADGAVFIVRDKKIYCDDHRSVSKAKNVVSEIVEPPLKKEKPKEITKKQVYDELKEKQKEKEIISEVIKPVYKNINENTKEKEDYYIEKEPVSEEEKDNEEIRHNLSEMYQNLNREKAYKNYSYEDLKYPCKIDPKKIEYSKRDVKIKNFK